MKTFGFIVNPGTAKRLRRFWPFEAFRRSARLIRTKPVLSANGITVSGCLIAPQFKTQEFTQEFLIEQIISSAAIAQKMGCSILGLEGFEAILKDKSKILAKSIKLPVTGGGTLAAWSIFETIYRITKANKLDLTTLTATIIGRDSVIGKLCAAKLSDYGTKALEENNIKNADITINADSCTVTFKNIGSIQAGLIKLPHPENFDINLGLDKGLIPASLAETILLTMDGKFTNYSFGDNINPDKMEEIADIAARHGFEIWVPQAPVL